MFRWTNRSTDDVSICRVCGEEKRNHEECCKMSPYITLKDFKTQYFGDEPVDPAIAKEFWDDYLTSGVDNLEEYTKLTVRSVL